MTPHETLEIFSALWWQANCITIGIIILILFLGQKSNVENKERLAKIIGLILIARSIGIHFYLDYLLLLIFYHQCFVEMYRAIRQRFI